MKISPQSLSIIAVTLASPLMFALSCGNTGTVEKAPTAKVVSSEFQDYWYDGLAEVNSYRLTQARYGELHQGEAVNIFVTEPFNTDKQVKSDSEGLSVMKVNMARKFLTGVYPYSVMTSAFTLVGTDELEHPEKVTFSGQEWCGHVWHQLNRKGNKYHAALFSYFESEGDATKQVNDVMSEDGVWAAIRMSPDQLPTGEFKMIPSLLFLRFRHIELDAFLASAEVKTSEGLSTYMIEYPELGRSVEIEFESNFPYRVLGWKETYRSGWGASAAELITEAQLIESKMLPYWQLHSNADSVYRDSLGLRESVYR